MFAVLESAFSWFCEECENKNWIDAVNAEIDFEVAGHIKHQLETVDALKNKDKNEDHDLESDYLVTSVVIGPPFVKCDKCGKMYATKLQEEQYD
jgi:hypothetical protein